MIAVFKVLVFARLCCLFVFYFNLSSLSPSYFILRDTELSFCQLILNLSKDKKKIQQNGRILDRRNHYCDAFN